MPSHTHTYIHLPAHLPVILQLLLRVYPVSEILTLLDTANADCMLCMESVLNAPILQNRAHIYVCMYAMRWFYFRFSMVLAKFRLCPFSIIVLLGAQINNFLFLFITVHYLSVFVFVFL